MKQTMMQRVKNTRTESTTRIATMEVGKLNPVNFTPILQNEGGVASFKLNLELAPIAGRMWSTINARVTTVFVPVLALDELENPDDNTAGIPEIVRDKLKSGAPLFGLSNENPVSRMGGVVPAVDGNGNSKVTRAVQLAYNSAVNMLRRRVNPKAAQLPETNANITPALLSTTSLDVFNAVLDPESRVDGAIDLTLGDIPVKGIGFRDAGTDSVGTGDLVETETGLRSSVPVRWDRPTVGNTNGVTSSGESQIRVERDPATGYPKIYASGSAGADISLRDFYQAEKMDALARQFRQMVDNDPVHGEEQVANAAYGLSVETGKTPFVVYQKEWPLNQMPLRGTDGPSLDIIHTEVAQSVEYTVPIPRTEFGGMLVSFVEVKPAEIVDDQPHPILSQPWGGRNYAMDELQLEPVKVTAKELYADVDTADRDTLCFYVGHNHMLRRYESQGFARSVDQTTVENKTGLWQYSIPLSQTPENTVYPETIDTYPFSDQTSPQVTCVTQARAVIRTPLTFGPSPVEALDVLDGNDILEIPADE